MPGSIEIEVFDRIRVRGLDSEVELIVVVVVVEDGGAVVVLD